MKNGHRIFTTAATLVLLAGAFATANADELSRRYTYDEKQAVIHLASANLSNPSDARQVVAQIEEAARTVCEREGSPVRLKEGRDLARCIETTYVATLAEINARFSIDLETVAASNISVPELISANK